MKILTFTCYIYDLMLQLNITYKLSCDSFNVKLLQLNNKFNLYIPLSS